jgi:hypothetical protein
MSSTRILLDVANPPPSPRRRRGSHRGRSRWSIGALSTVLLLLVLVLIVVALAQNGVINKIGYGPLSIDFGHNKTPSSAPSTVQPPKTSSPAAAPANNFRFTNLLANGVTPEPCAFTVKGRGVVPHGQALVVSNQEEGTGNGVDPLLHYGPATTKPDSDLWFANVQIGVDRTKPWTRYALTAWLMNATWGRSQPVVAIQAEGSSLSWRRSSANTSLGFLNPSIARGRSFSSSAMAHR